MLGLSFNYFEYLILILILCHTLILFWNVWCPLGAHKMLKSRRRHHLHATVLTLVIFLPCVLCVGVVLGHLFNAAYYAFVPFYALCGILTATIELIILKLICLDQNDLSSVSCNEFAEVKLMHNATIYCIFI